MSRHSCLALALAGLLLPGVAAASDPVPDLPGFVDRFLSQRADPATAMRVRDLTLTRDAARYVLEDGDLWFCEPVEGEVRAAVFAGAGSFRVEPPTAFERAELQRFCGAPILERRFKALVLVFADGTDDELRGHGPAADKRVAADAAEALAWYLEAVGERKSIELDPGLAWPFVNGRNSGLFSSLVVGEDERAFFYQIDPRAYEEVTLWRVPPSKFLTARSLDHREVVCSFPLGGRYDSTAVGDWRPDIAVRDYRLECTISSVLEFSAVAEMRCRTVADPAAWIPFQLFRELTVDSVHWDGAPATFTRGRGSPTIWVRLPSAPGPDGDHVLRIAYRGHLLHSAGDWIMLRSTTGWYPKPLSTGEATFDLTFHSPAEYLLRSVGEEADRVERDRVVHSRWVVRRPSRNVTFVLGRFVEQTFGAGATPPVIGLMFDGKPGKVTYDLGGVSMREGARLEDWVVDDVVRCVAFFQENLGPAQVPGFTVGQMPSLHGEAFPGLINIPETAFAGETAVAEDQAFRAHEVAHQWWGYTVASRSYHDHWLQEGFADFSALWYLQAGLGRTRDYLALLRNWGEDLFRDSEVRPDKGRPAGPIWLGYRNSTYARPYDYVIVDYKKGAWVLQMLRAMLLDLETMDDARFTGLMREFYRTFAGGTASTADFRRIAEKHAGEDLGWFFDQWVFGTGMPVYRFASNTVRGEDGNYRVSCRVEQSGVAEDFRMPVILRVEFGGEQFAWVRRTVAGPVSRFELPPLPMAPTRIVFNDVASVLCRVKTEPW